MPQHPITTREAMGEAKSDKADKKSGESKAEDLKERGKSTRPAAFTKKGK